MKQPSRLKRMLERILTHTEHAMRVAQIFQLLGGLVLIALLDLNFALIIRTAHATGHSASWLAFAIPIGVTLAWLVIAAINVHQLWDEWRHRGDDDDHRRRHRSDDDDDRPRGGPPARSVTISSQEQERRQERERELLPV